MGCNPQNPPARKSFSSLNVFPDISAKIQQITTNDMSESASKKVIHAETRNILGMATIQGRNCQKSLQKGKHSQME
jgi:hypothetical protein